MKRIICISILIMSLVAHMISCNPYDFENHNNGHVVFGIEYEDWTKGVPIKQNANIPDMKVYCYYSGLASSTWNSSVEPNFMNGVLVSNGGVNTGTASWSYSNPVYWPKEANANLSFFAFSPAPAINDKANGISVQSTKGTPVIRYSVPTTTVNQPDLMVAVPQKNVNPPEVGKSKLINFSMKHALACISFQAKGMGNIITSIEVEGIKTSGDLACDGSGNIEWSNLSSDGIKITPGLKTPENSITGSLTNDLTASNGYLMMIPQELTAKAKITVNIKYGDPVIFTGAKLQGHIWTAGVIRNYNITLPKQAIIPKEISKTVSGWESTVEIPINTIACASWTATTSASWIKLTGSSGTNNSSIKMNFERNWDKNDILNAPSDRSGKIELTSMPAGASSTIEITQKGVVGAIKMTINNRTLTWAVGNLVANVARGQAGCGNGDVTIGNPMNAGLAFQYGSTVGFSAGALINGGNGRGFGPTMVGGQELFWGNKSVFSPDDYYVRPKEMTAAPQFFNWRHSGSLSTTDYDKGFGDPCKYYLGGKWRLPTKDDFGADAKYFSSSVTIDGINGRWLGATPNNSNSIRVFFPYAGFRSNGNGAIKDVNRSGSYWSQTTDPLVNGNSFYVGMSAGIVNPGNSQLRATVFSVRCVRD